MDQAAVQSVVVLQLRVAKAAVFLVSSGLCKRAGCLVPRFI
jgi:hypothetical protein